MCCEICWKMPSSSHPRRAHSREEEKNRTRQFLHDILSAKLIVASFATREVYQKLIATGAEGSEELAMVTKLLEETISNSAPFIQPLLTRFSAIRRHMQSEREPRSSI